MSANSDDSLNPTDRWARRVCEASGPQDSAGRLLEDGARTLLFGADTVAADQDDEGRDLEDRAYAGLFGAPPPRDDQPRMIGKYRLGRLLGGGGMGEVFLAEDTELGRKAALKLLRARIRDDSRERDRLMREAQALAALNDPNVVGVFDCGVHEDRVYLAMEYVEGTTLRAWQDDRPRGWREVLAHYLAAGRGLAAIHAAGLVHRDFKPQNVLVSHKGEVKITDFGLAVAPGARARKPDTAADRAALLQLLAVQLTTTAAVLGTPLYISPEQLASEPVDARSDQFSFCVALYEALYGGHPYAAPETTPNSRATTAGKGSRGAVGTSPSGPPSMMSLVTGLIDGPLRRPPKIVIPGRVYRAIERGLARDPKDRYPTMEALLADLARDPLRKYGPAAALAVLGFAGGLAALAPSVLGVCKGIASEFDDAWSDALATEVEQAFLRTGSPHAQTAAAHVRRTLDDYRVRWIAARTDNCDATEARGAQAQEVHHRRNTCLNEARATVKTIASELTRADATAVASVTDTLALLPPLEQCSADFQAQQTCLDGADDPKLREALDRALALEIAGKLTEAEAAAEAVLTGAAGRPRLAAEAELLRGRVRAEQSRSAAADAAFAAAHSLSEQAGCDALAFEAATRHAKLVALHFDLPAERGLAWSNVAHAKLQRLPSKSLEAEYHSDLGLLYQHRDELPGKPAERLALARAEHERAFDLRKQLAGGGKTLDLMISHLNLADLTTKEGKPEKALDDIEASLALHTEFYGPDHPRLWLPFYVQGNALLDLKRLPEARRALERAIDLAGAGLGPQHVKVGLLKHSLAVSYFYAESAAERAQALGLEKSALAIYERELPELDPRRADPWTLLGLIYADRGEPAEALPYQEQALRHLRHADTEARAQAHIDLAWTLLMLGRIDDSVDHLHLARALVAELDPAPEILVEQLQNLKSELARRSTPIH